MGMVAPGVVLDNLSWVVTKTANIGVDFDLWNDYQINAKYIYHIMRSEYMLKQMYDNSKGTTVDTITIEKAKQYILPLPPLAEQQRIVAKIEETFSIFDGIQNSLEA